MYCKRYCPNHITEKVFFPLDVGKDHIIRVTMLLLAKKSYRSWNSKCFVAKWNSIKPKSNAFIPQINKSPPGAAFQVALVVKNPSANAGDVRDVGSIPGSKRSSGGGDGNPFQYCPWTEEPGGLQSTGSHRVGHDRSNLACKHAHTHQEPGTVSGTEDIQEGIQPPKSCPQGTHIIMSNSSSNFSQLLLCEVTEPPWEQMSVHWGPRSFKTERNPFKWVWTAQGPKAIHFQWQGFSYF